MTVYSKIIRTKTSMDKIRQYCRERHGIDCIPLGASEGIGYITVKFVCSDKNLTEPRTMKDIDNIVMKLEDAKELQDHRNDPAKKMNHMLQISVDMDAEVDGKPQGDSKEVERG